MPFGLYYIYDCTMVIDIEAIFSSTLNFYKPKYNVSNHLIWQSKYNLKGAVKIYIYIYILKIYNFKGMACCLIDCVVLFLLFGC